MYLKALVLGLLALVGLDGHILKNADLLRQVTLNVIALGDCNCLNRILLTLKLAHFLASKLNDLLQLVDLFLKLVDGRLKAKGLRGTECRI